MAVLLLVLAGCTAVPAGLTAVKPFEAERYLGRWFEIARLDHSFERGLTDVSADYEFRADGTLSVVNRGYDPSKGEWRVARGRARFRGAADTASLVVCFFWPFCGGYHVIELDRQHYGYALVAGPSRSYLWILAREPRLSPELLQALVARAAQLGFDTAGLIYVTHRGERQLQRGLQISTPP